MDIKRLRDIYRKLVLIRECENYIIGEYAQDEMKTPVHLSVGAEAISVGITEVFGNRSLYLGTYRSHAPYLAATNDVEGFFAELYGRERSPTKGKAGSMHLNNRNENFILSSAVVGTPLPIALGVAYTQKLKGESGSCIAFVGDGATEEGSFWESINFACLHNIPLLVVVENNALAIHAHINDRQSHYGLEEVSKAFPINYEKGDGENINSVIKSAEKIKEKMMENNRPAIIEYNYHRFFEHVGVNEDYDQGYRSRPGNTEAHDPILRLEKDMNNDIQSGIDTDAIKKDVEEIIYTAVAKAKASPPPDVSELNKDIFSILK